MGGSPSERRPLWFIVSIFAGQFGIFLALLAPVMVSIHLKVVSLTDDPAEQAAMLPAIIAPGALAAVVFNALGGRLSDRTTSRFGRRRPWLIGGMVGLTLSLLLIAVGSEVWMLTVGWFLAQATANFTFAPYIASLNDQLPKEQYGTTSGLVGIA